GGGVAVEGGGGGGRRGELAGGSDGMAAKWVRKGYVRVEKEWSWMRPFAGSFLNCCWNSASVKPSRRATMSPGRKLGPRKPISERRPLPARRKNSSWTMRSCAVTYPCAKPNAFSCAVLLPKPGGRKMCGTPHLSRVMVTLAAWPEATTPASTATAARVVRKRMGILPRGPLRYPSAHRFGKEFRWRPCYARPPDRHGGRDDRHPGRPAPGPLSGPAHARGGPTGRALR